MTVVATKSEKGRRWCCKCFYCKRGSFKNMKSGEFLRLKRRNPQLAKKFLGRLIYLITQTQTRKYKERQARLLFHINVPVSVKLITYNWRKRRLTLLEPRLSPSTILNPLRFAALRKKHVSALAHNPRGRPRHEAVNVDLYITKTNQKYVDFRQDTWR